MRAPAVIDVSDLSPAGSGSRSTLWWAMIGLIAIEGSMFAMVFATFLYVRGNFYIWPPPGVRPPGLLLPTIDLAILILSAVPMYLSDKSSVLKKKGLTAIYLSLGVVMAAAFMWIRFIEWHSLNYRWDSHIYGSIVWTALGLHSFHVLASLGETIVILAAVLTKPLRAHLHGDIEVDSLYWYFIVISWIPFYFAFYVGPHMQWW